jgi:ribosomal-protein-serine acetyltransferase
MLRLRLTGDAELREVVRDDIDELYAVSLTNQEHLRPWMPWAADIRREHTARYVEGALVQRERNDGTQFVLTVGGVIAGAFGFHRIDWTNRATTIGYWIAERHQGRGLATAAVRAMCDHAFVAWELHRVEIDPEPGNARSRAIPERLGFTQEGVRRGGERFGDEYRDLLVYSLLASD